MARQTKFIKDSTISSNRVSKYVGVRWHRESSKWISTVLDKGITGVELIAIERKRQIEELGYDYTNDSLYANEELAKAAAWYSLPTFTRIKFESMQIKDSFKNTVVNIWPWDILFYKPSPDNRIKELAKAGALIAAQIDYELNKKK